KESIVWKDGEKMSLFKTQAAYQNKIDSPFNDINSPSLWTQLTKESYQTGKPLDIHCFSPQTDPGRIRYEPFFKKMYGKTEEEVRTKLVKIYWLSHLLGKNRPLLMTSVNGVDKKLAAISLEIEMLVAKHPEYLSFLKNPGGTFSWR